MSEGSASQAVAVLVAAFRQEKISEPTIAVYVRKLADIPEPLLAASVDRLIDSSRFFPSIAEIRQMAAGLAGVLPVSPEEALAIVRKADVEESVYDRGDPPQLAYVERYWAWPPETPRATVEAIKRVLTKVGDPVGKDDERIFGWEQDFRRSYEVVAAEEAQEALADLSRAALPVPSREALEVSPAHRLPALTGHGQLPCGFDPALGGRHRPDCPTCAAVGTSWNAAGLAARDEDQAEVEKNLAKVRVLVGDLARKKAAEMTLPASEEPKALAGGEP